MGETIRDNVLKVVGEELDSLRERIIANHEAAGQVASGRTRASIRVERTEDGGILWGRKAFGVLETGRKPGRVPRNFNAIIRQWIIDKGIHVAPVPYKRNPSERWQPKYTPQERGLMSLSGAIAYKIRTEGTLMHRKGEKVDIYSTAVLEAVDNVGRKVSAIFDTEVEHINLNFSKDED